MKYISFTFDDGRKDNYIYALPVMEKYNIVGTLYCTTGYIDGTWQKSADWCSAESPLSVDEISLLQKAGWEIGLHGDKHITSVEDLKIAYRKFLSWGLPQKEIGFSIPNSSVNSEQLNQVISQCFNKEIAYIRTGRKINTQTLKAKILFALYSYVGSQWAYNQFNYSNINNLQSIQKTRIYSIVIRCGDKHRMLANFVEQMPDNSWAVLMFHSILPEKHPLYMSDPWNWSCYEFEMLCERLTKQGKILPVHEVLAKFVDKRKG